MTTRIPKSWKKYIRGKKADLRRAGKTDEEVTKIIASEYARLKAAPAVVAEKKPAKKSKPAKKVAKPKKDSKK